MDNLDDILAVNKLDKVNVLGSIEKLGEQCLQAWSEVAKIQFPDTYKNVNNIVFSGMGGSALGAYVVKSLFSRTLPLPFEIINDYKLPQYVNDKTLVILSSYSGTTEETLSSAKNALERKAQITGLTTGGRLGEIFRENNLPCYIFNPINNPSNQPRLGTGYSVFGLIALFNKLGFQNIAENEIKETLLVLNQGNNAYGVGVATEKNRAKLLAKNWLEKIPVIVTAEFLVHVGRVIRNQFHESAKTFAAYHEIPELNHHLMEGLSNPKTNKEILRFLFLSSSLYCDKIKKRVKITMDVVSKQGIPSETFSPTATTKIAQALECIQFGAYLNYYIALLYNLDPSEIPWVDYFKAELAKE